MSGISFKSLAHSYNSNDKNNRNYAIHPMDHTWEKGGAYALLGPSGCGKSTLLNIISGLLTPSEGEVLFDGINVNQLPPEKRNIAQVFQFPVVYDSMSVFGNLAFPLKNTNVPESVIHERVKEIAAILDLSNKLSDRAKNLTADDKQKVSMGRALVRKDVSTILFDEPLTVIDPQLKWKLRRKLKQIHKKFGMTMIYVTHDQLEASTFADKVAVMYEGRIVQFGTPRELFENPKHTFVGYFIGSPGMNLINVKRSTRGVSFDDVEIQLPASVLECLQKLSYKKLTLGIRPEFLSIFQLPVSGTIECTFVRLEDMGAYKMLTIMLGKQLLKVRLGEHQTISTDQIYIRFPEQWLKIYVDEYLLDEVEM